MTHTPQSTTLRARLLKDDELTRLRQEAEDYRAWRAGKLGVEEFYALRRENHRLAAELAELRASLVSTESTS